MKELLNNKLTYLANRVLRMNKIIILVYICMAVITSCSKIDTTSSNETTSQEEALLIGLIPERNIFEQIKRYEPIADYLSEKIGIKIKLKVLPRYGNIIDNFVSGNMDGAFFGSFTYTLAHAKLCKYL